MPEQNLDNDDSKAKAKIGQQWDTLAGSKFRYFMVFQSKVPDFPGAYSYDQFMWRVMCADLELAERR